MTVRDHIVRQFKRPEGALGQVAGWIMATRPSNRQRNYWTLDLLDIQPHDRVLEIGCGPGVALQACAERLSDGQLIGIDHSPLMLEHAARRCDRAIAEGRLQLLLRDLASLPAVEFSFDKVYSANVIQFVPDQVVAFRAIAAALVPGGLVATTYQPRHRNATKVDALRKADAVVEAMSAAGFTAIRVEQLPLSPVLAVCVLGSRSQHE